MTESADTAPQTAAPEVAEAGRNRPEARLVARYGRQTLLVLAVIVCAGFLARAWFVVNPDTDPGDDSFAYRALAESLYTDGSYGGPGFNNPSDWSPGAPLIYAGSYFLTGGVRDGVARGAEALFGAGTILLAFFLTARLTGPPGRAPGEDPGAGAGTAGHTGTVPPPVRAYAAPLIAAALVACYPPFVAGPGSLMSEPPAEFTLPAAILAFLWADRRNGLWPWIPSGLLFGLTCLIRPEYMLIAVLFGLLLLIRAGLKGSWGRAILATVLFGCAALVPVVPWTVHNYVTLDRVVPVTTGSGKALFTGTYRPGDGEYQRVKAALLEEQTGRRLEPGSAALDRVDPVPLFDRVAARYPELDRDAALGRTGRENLQRYLDEDPLGYLGMTVRKAWRMWGSASGGVLGSGPGALIQKLLVLSGIAGLLLLAWRSRWEAIALAIPLVGITVVGSLTLAPPRRNEILMTLILPLASVAFTQLPDRTGRNRSGPRPAGPALPEKESAA